MTNAVRKGEVAVSETSSRRWHAHLGILPLTTHRGKWLHKPRRAMQSLSRAAASSCCMAQSTTCRLQATLSTSGYQLDAHLAGCHRRPARNAARTQVRRYDCTRVYVPTPGNGTKA